MPILDLFLDVGGPWITLLAALAWISFSRLSSIQDEPARWVEALSQPWVMKAAVLLALLAWIWSLGRLFTGNAYLRGSGTFTELSTALLALVLMLAAAAWRGIRSTTRPFPWLTYGLAVSLIVSAGALLATAPENDLSQGSENGDWRAVAFAQSRLADLNCFQASRGVEETGGRFGAFTAAAVVAFQQANHLIRDFDVDPPGVIVIPRQGWPSSSTITVSVDALAEDASGNVIIAPFSFSFTTSAQTTNAWTLDADYNERKDGDDKVQTDRFDEEILFQDSAGNRIFINEQTLAAEDVKLRETEPSPKSR